MSTRLIQVLTFTNVAPSATVVQAHQININGTPTRPDLVAADVSGFAITADATQVSVTNNNPDPTTVHVWLERKHTTPRELGGLANLSPQPFVFAAGGSGGGSTPSAVFQWSVGVPWATVYAAMQAVTGPKICLVEFETAARQMTNNGGVPTDLNNVLFMGLGGTGQDGTCAVIQVEDGFKLADRPAFGGVEVRLQSNDIEWNFSALTTPAYTVVNLGQDYVAMTLNGGRITGNGAGVGVIVGTLWLSLHNVQAAGGVVGRCTSTNSELWMSGGTRMFNPIFEDDGGGNSLSVYADASCDWSAAQLTATGLFLSPYAVANFAKGAGQTLYSISVDGGGNVVATLVP